MCDVKRTLKTTGPDENTHIRSPFIVSCWIGYLLTPGLPHNGNSFSEIIYKKMKPPAANTHPARVNWPQSFTMVMCGETPPSSSESSWETTHTDPPQWQFLTLLSLFFVSSRHVGKTERWEGKNIFNTNPKLRHKKRIAIIKMIKLYWLINHVSSFFRNIKNISGH